VVITSRNLDSARESAESLSQRAKAPVVALELDVTDQESVGSVFGEVESRFGRLDALVNNAGGAPATDKSSLFERRLKDWDSTLRTNLTGAFLCTQAAANIMRRQETGSIVNISSIAGIVGRDLRIYEDCDMRPNIVDYAASKAGMLGLTRESAASLGRFNIRVNAVLPGGFERGQPQAFIDRYCDKTPLRRMGRDRVDLKGAVALLASPAGAYISGACIVVDGGFAIFK
jgi:NAD(P)-dependent dehydrogenase (short-subunit alcohol dehydrogenase family)